MIALDVFGFAMSSTVVDVEEADNVDGEGKDACGECGACKNGECDGE